jgi:hypothetical protein
LFTKPKQHAIEIIYGRGNFKFVGDLNIGRGKFVGDFNMGNIICANFTRSVKFFTQIMLPILKSPTNFARGKICT